MSTDPVRFTVPPPGRHRLGRGRRVRKVEVHPRLPNAMGRDWRAVATQRRWRTVTMLAAVDRRVGLAGVALGNDHRFRVTLLRVRRPGNVADHDNVVASMKHVRDGVADALWFGCTRHTKACGPIHDGDPRIEWVVREVFDRPSRMEVLVEVLEEPGA